MNDTMDDRTMQYRRLVSARKLCRERGLTNASMIGNEDRDSAEIGPWTRWLGAGWAVRDDLRVTGEVAFPEGPISA